MYIVIGFSLAAFVCAFAHTDARFMSLTWAVLAVAAAVMYR